MHDHTVTLPVAAWGQTTTLDLSFPEDWTVTCCRMAGHDAPGLSDDQIRAALASPLSTPRLSEMARGKKRVAILFDDLTRPTPAYRVVPFVLEELRRGGINDDQVRFIAAIGTHAPMPRSELVKKLGEDIVERFPVYNHNIYDNVAEVGVTSYGTPVFINREAASCDLKVGIGGILPYGQKHVYNGGGKIILPGISGIETIVDYHVKVYERIKDFSFDPRVVEGIPPYRVNLEEAARLAELDMKVDLVQNNRKEVVGLFAGDFIQTHRTGSQWARCIYTTPVAPPSDVVILNSYPKEDQPLVGLWVAIQSVKPGGDIVIFSHSTNGIAHVHYLFGRFGDGFGGPGWSPGRHFQAAEARRVIFCSPYLSKADMDNYSPERVTFCKSWNEVRTLLERERNGQTSVAIYPYGALQTV
ncbi:MAG: DUF2088 domain-containing protein [Candidatus Latescibacteria bacterium]|nr:DUF2088 domain-containing protein [Candidatus Latescibacterota bacterium]